MRKYCEECGKEVETTFITKREEYDVCGETIEVDAHLPYGPVPENVDIVLGTMAADHIAHIEVSYDNGFEKHQVIPEKDMPEGVLSEDELAVLERVNHKFASFGSADISHYSHREKGYTDTKQGEIISYSYAKNMELNE